MEFCGGCQCGRVRYRAEGPRDRASVCYCRMCQKASGGPFMAFVRFPVQSVTWTQAEPEVFNSSNRVERGFCGRCGTPLTYRHLGGDFISVTLGSLDQPETIQPEMSFVATRKPGWLHDLDDLPNETMDLVSDPGFVSYQVP